MAVAAPAKPRRRPAVERPFTLAHFERWALQFELDNGKPWRLQPFQRAFIRDVFRGFPICWLVIPEGNTKTTTIAGLALYHIEFTPSAYVPVAASARDQAEWIYRQAAGFVRRSAREATRKGDAGFQCLEGYRRIKYEALDSRIQIFAADDRSGDGAIGTLFILDELHRHRDMALYRTWAGKLGKIPGAQLIVISTAGEVGSEFELERERFRQSGTVIRKGAFVRAESRKAVLHDWALEEGADPEDLRAVKRANPFSGITLTTLREKREIPGMTPGHWARFTCNRASRSEFAAITEAEWFEAIAEEGIPAGIPIWAGLDVAFKWDTTAIVPLWWKEAEYRLLGPARVLVPPRDGQMLDPYKVERALVEVHERNPIHTVVMDTHHAADIAAWIQSELGATVIDRGQGLPFHADDYERFMEALRRGWLKHAGDQALTSHVLNAIAQLLPRGDVRFNRPSSTRQGGNQDLRVIDALTAAAMVHSAAAIAAQTPQKRSRVVSF